MEVRPSEGGLRRRRMPLRRITATKKGVPRTGSVGGRAMRYYRLWIYTCNTALLAGTLAFCIAAAKTLVMDFRRALLPPFTLYQPSFLYAYLALVTQGGAIQLLGCLAAVRLSEKLLNAYWLLMLVLLFGDVVLGTFWAFRIDRLRFDVEQSWNVSFTRNYGNDTAMTAFWDRLQLEDSCCGFNGSMDFGPNTLPESCCSQLATTNGTTKCLKTNAVGCKVKVAAYVNNTASLLAILGYCVLAFLKLVFLGILRYEIREMIQKIRILQAELDLTSANGMVQMGSMRAAEAAMESDERESLLVRPESVAMLSSPPTHSKNPNGNNNYELREYRSHENLRLM